MKLPATGTTFFMLAVVTLREANAGTIEVTTCDDLISAVEATAIEDTVAKIITSASFDCGIGSSSLEEVRTLKIENNHLTVAAPDLSANDGPQFWEVRFEVVSGGELTVVPNVSFGSTSDVPQEKNGGWLHVGEGSKVRFLGDVDVTGYKVTSVTDPESDFTNDRWNGGCVWNQGYFRVEGYITFERCDSVGGGESGPGDGGAVYNDAMGSILFNSGVRIEETRISDDDGGTGGGIYNLGKVNIKGDSLFKDVYADTQNTPGGAIFNGEGASFNFRNKANAVFINTAAEEGGAVYNQGEFRFSGPALFTMTASSAIYNVSPGNMKLSDGSSFWLSTDSDYNRGGAVTNRLGATLDIPDKLVFVATGGSSNDCDKIYLETEDGFTCYP